MKLQPVICGLVAAAVLGAGTAWAQSLGDIAKKEQERQKSVKGTGKVYTDNDLLKYPARPPAPGDAPGNPVVPPRDDSAAQASPPPAKTANEVPPGQEKGESYWKGLLADAQARIDRNRSSLDALEKKLASFDTVLVDRDDVALRSWIGQQRARALDEIERLKKAIEDGVKEIEKIREDARRQGVPPGWLR